MRTLLAHAFSLLMAGPALAQSCLPTPLEQTSTFYRVSFGGLIYTLNYNRLKATGNNARAEEARQILQFRADYIQPLQTLIIVGDPDGMNDPDTNRVFHSDPLGNPANEGQATHITSRCTVAEVEWLATIGDFRFTWRGAP